MIRLDPKTTAVVSIDMHRGHLDPAVATMPLHPEQCRVELDSRLRKRLGCGKARAQAFFFAGLQRDDLDLGIERLPERREHRQAAEARVERQRRRR